MKLALLRKSLRESQLLLGSSTLIMFAFCWLRVWIISLFPTERFKAILEQFREFERFVPVPFEQLFTYSGRIALTYDELIVVMCMAIWAVARGSDCVAGEIGRGTMEMILAQPISRSRLLLSQSLVTTMGVALLALASWGGLYFGIAHSVVEEPVAQPKLSLPMLGLDPASLLREGETRSVPMSTKVSPHAMWPAAVNLFAMGFFLSGLSTLVSAPDRYRWRTIGIVSAIYVVQLIMKIVGLAADRFSWMLSCTFFTAYDPERFVSVAVNTPENAWRVLLYDESGGGATWGPMGFDLLLIGMGLLAYLLAMLIFAHRDLPAPV